MLQFLPLILSANTRELISNTINLAGDLETSARLDSLQDSIDTITAGIMGTKIFLLTYLKIEI